MTIRPKLSRFDRDFLKVRIDLEKRRRRTMDYLLTEWGDAARIGAVDSAIVERRVEEMAKIESVVFPVEGRAAQDPEVADLVDSMAEAIVAEEWRGDNKPHKAKKEAANVSQLLRRHVARKLNVPEKRVRSRVRDLEGKGDEKNGKWVWGLRLRTDAEMAKLNGAGTGDAPTTEG